MTRRFEKVLPIHAPFEPFPEKPTSPAGVYTNARVTEGGYISFTSHTVKDPNKLSHILIFPDDLDRLAEAISLARKEKRRHGRLLAAKIRRQKLSDMRDGIEDGPPNWVHSDLRVTSGQTGITTTVHVSRPTRK